MPTPTYTPLANLTLGSTAASVTFSSISQGFRDLILVVNAGNSGNIYSELRARFNSDSGSNYSFVYALGNGSATVSGSDTQTSTIAGATGASGSSTIIQVMDYSATDKHKTVLNRRVVADASGYSNGMEAGRWANTAAITSIYLFDGAGYNFDTGSTFSLFGVAA